ncbi:MAG: hypothetical protein ABFD04_03710 [Syntrophomonas sp.]
MVWSKVEQVREQIVGLRPVYSSIGNSTEVLMLEGQTISERRVLKSSISALARSYAVDLAAQRSLVRTWLGKQTLVPFYLSPERVFIPLKMRQSRAGNDETYGYLDVKLVQDIKELARRRCQVMLENGIVLEILSGKSTVLQSQHNGRRLLTMLGNIENPANDEDNAVESARWMVRTLKKISLQLDRMEGREN